MPEEKKIEVKQEPPKEEKKDNRQRNAILWAIGVFIAMLLFMAFAYGLNRSVISAKFVIISIFIVIGVIGAGIALWLYIKRLYGKELVMKELTPKEAEIQAEYDIELRFGHLNPVLTRPMGNVPISNKAEIYKFCHQIFEIETGDTWAYVINRLNPIQKDWVNLTDCRTEKEMIDLIKSCCETIAGIEKRQRIERTTSEDGKVTEILYPDYQEVKEVEPFAI